MLWGELLEVNKVYNTDALSGLQDLPDGSVDMCVTSPPYWGLRDYGCEGQLGLEPSFDEYITKLVAIFGEVHRVLKDTGTLWVNISDSYGGSGSPGGDFRDGKGGDTYLRPYNRKGVTPKSLCGIPERFVIAMTDEGWIRRNTVIWHKPNCMPSSVKDRFTVDFEYLYFFSKQQRYHFEQQTEPFLSDNSPRKFGGNKAEGYGNPTYSGNIYDNSHLKGRNMRCVWRVSTKPYKGAHFAVFPEDLIETPIKAGCPQFICNKCGVPKQLVRVTKSIQTRPGVDNKDGSDIVYGSNKKKRSMPKLEREYYSDCGCGAGFHPGVVLDPFMGSGTTASVAKRLGRDYVGFELNPEYMDLISERLRKTVRIKSLKEYGVI